MPIRIDNLPPQLPEDRFVGWNWVFDAKLNGGKGKWTKPPANCLGGPGSSTDPSTWCDLATAFAAAEAGEVDGIGVPLGDLGDGRTLVGIDLDDCRDPDSGKLTAEAELIVRKVPIYWEVSPSGTGLKGLCFGEKPAGKCKSGNFEMFAGGKYFTLTGHALPGCSRQLIDATPQLAWFHASFIAAPELPGVPATAGDNRDVAIALDALAGMSAQRADDYDDWIITGMVLRSIDAGLLNEWDQWSRQSAKYSPGVCAEKWATFNGAGFGLGSLIHMASQDGWKPKAQDKPKRIRYKVLTCAELSKGDYSLEFLIDNTLVAAQPLIIAGAQKTLKTSFIVDAAISLATGGYFLGRLPVQRACRVGVMTGESGLATIQENAINVCRAAGKWLDQVEGLFWSEDLPRFGDPAHMEAVEAFLLDYEIETLFVDPAYLCLPATDSGNLIAQGELLRGMAEVCRRNGALLALCHHTKKNTGRDPYEPPELPDIAWSGFAEFCRQWWLIGRRDKYEPGTGKHKLWLSIGGSAGHSALWAVDVSEGTRTDPEGRRWEVSLHAPSEARSIACDDKARAKERRAAEQLGADKRAACGVLAQFPGGLTKTCLRDRAGLGKRFEGVLAALLEEKAIEPCDVLVSNHKTPKEGYRLGG
ncbi:MAG: PriCT-2 domain-containing protein, partial [Pirellulales bacterium]|nr:PriCT-2 domain-containing protein [Pirellulales bacterium]